MILKVNSIFRAGFLCTATFKTAGKEGENQRWQYFFCINRLSDEAEVVGIDDYEKGPREERTAKRRRSKTLHMDLLEFLTEY